jgi:hypothetical protein
LKPETMPPKPLDEKLTFRRLAKRQPDPLNQPSGGTAIFVRRRCRLSNRAEASCVLLFSLIADARPLAAPGEMTNPVHRGKARLREIPFRESCFFSMEVEEQDRGRRLSFSAG